jgi:hypothetical protein
VSESSELPCVQDSQKVQGDRLRFWHEYDIRLEKAQYQIGEIKDLLSEHDVDNDVTEELLALPDDSEVFGTECACYANQTKYPLSICVHAQSLWIICLCFLTPSKYGLHFHFHRRSIDLNIWHGCSSWPSRT